LVFAFAFLLVLSPSSLLGVDAATCPDAQILTPCTCGNYNTNLLYLNCASKSLTDGRIELILSFFQSNDTQLGRLDLYNNPLLTHVPPAIKTFTQLGDTVQLQLNGFTSIESGAFQFQDSANPVKDLYLNSNKLTTISPNAFNGIRAYTMNTIINLSSNQLSRFESTVFQSLLEKFVPFGGLPFAYVNILSNPFNCSDCHLAWLIRDNPNLKTVISGGVCSNGTAFSLLNANGYANCPRFSCPLDYDGNYYDPTDRCNKYYTCISGIAYPTNCPIGLVFNPDTGTCQSPANVPDCQ